MTDPKPRSKRRSSGKSGQAAPPLKNFTLYLDESFDCDEVKDALTRAGYKFKVYSETFKPGTADDRLLERAGRKGWAMLTCDKQIRFRTGERVAVQRHRVRQFVFSGNLGAPTLAALIVKVYPDMRQFARVHEKPFIASITESGKIALRMDKNGRYYGSRKS